MIWRGDEPNLRVVGRLEFEQDSDGVERFSVLVVDLSIRRARSTAPTGPMAP